MSFKSISCKMTMIKIKIARTDRGITYYHGMYNLPYFAWLQVATQLHIAIDFLFFWNYACFQLLKVDAKNKLTESEQQIYLYIYSVLVYLSIYIVTWNNQEWERKDEFGVSSKKWSNQYNKTRALAKDSESCSTIFFY